MSKHRYKGLAMGMLRAAADAEKSKSTLAQYYREKAAMYFRRCARSLQ